jgi:hypothetical protein
MNTERPPTIEQQARELLRELQAHIGRLDREIDTLEGKLPIVLECMRRRNLSQLHNIDESLF